jgi:hypothetical protein
MDAGQDAHEGRRIAYQLGVFTLIGAGLAGVEESWLGFPDGHLTPWERGHQQVLQAAMVHGLVSSAGFAALAYRDAPKGKVWQFAGLIGLIGLGLLAYDVVALADLPHGGGG